MNAKLFALLVILCGAQLATADDPAVTSHMPRDYVESSADKKIDAAIEKLKPLGGS